MNLLLHDMAVRVEHEAALTRGADDGYRIRAGEPNVTDEKLHTRGERHEDGRHEAHARHR